MWIRKLVIIATLAFATTTPARAEVGVGFFLGEPTGLDLKIDIARQSAFDILFGWYSHWNNFDNGGYFHFTYLFQPFVAVSGNVAVPLRVGVGLAVFDDNRYFDGNDLNVAARFPFEVAFRFLRTPVEIYGEIALKVTFIDENDNHPPLDLDGGIGVRFMF